MKTRLLKTIFIFVLLAASVIPSLTVQAAGALPAPAPRAASEIMPSFTDFVSSLTNGKADEVRGVYVPDLFAYKIVQQPAGKDGYVSTTKNVVTQFRMAAQYNVVGLLAHNYLAGGSFASLQIGQEVRLVYGDGKVVYYKVTVIASYQAITPSSATSDFTDLATGKTYTASQIFTQYYTGDAHLTFQTCIAKDKEPSWGRLFIVAVPDETKNGK